MFAILWISDPASPRGGEDGVTPRRDVEREPIRIDVCGGRAEAPVVIAIKIDHVKERDHLGSGDKRALKVDAHRWKFVVVTCMFASEELQITRC